MESEGSLLWLVLVDILAWFILHLGIAWLMGQIPDTWFAGKERGFRPQSWEKEGEIWQDLFGVRQWKKYLPDGSMFLPSSYDQTNLQGSEEEHLEKFILETKRAELTHWLMIPPACLFFWWNPPWAGILMIIYALGLNLPLIIAQRYNRPRLKRILHLQKRRKKKNE